jgi:hypothetical protein
MEAFGLFDLALGLALTFTLADFFFVFGAMVFTRMDPD